jgi:signal transduction histidine kinase
VHRIRRPLVEIPTPGYIAARVKPVSVPAAIPADEDERLADLYAYEILDSDPEESFDDIARLAAQICGTPWAVVNFIDGERQWSKAYFELVSDTERRQDAFCPHTIVSPDGFLVVEDALLDQRFAQNPSVIGAPNIRFYAGSAIRAASGRPIGSVCVVDRTPRTLTPDQREALRSLSRLATEQLELRRLLTGERRLVESLRELDRQKAEFTAVVAHDLRSPLTSIRGYAELLREGGPSERALAAIERNSDRLLRLVDDLTGGAGELALEKVDLAELARAAVEQARPAAHAGRVELELDLEPSPVQGDAHRLAQVFDNLIGNAVKYSPGGHVCIYVRPGGIVHVSDTGVGIPADELPRVFDRFYRASTSSGFLGSGIGLATAQAIVEAHGGAIEVTSEVGRGSTFRFELSSPSAN